MLHNLPPNLINFIKNQIDDGIETPFVVLNVAEVEKNYSEFFQNFPNVTPYYAVKANPHPGILRSLISKDSFFDIASVNEAKQVFELGSNPSKVIFANPVKKRAEIKQALEMGIKFFTLDSVEELHKIGECTNEINLDEDSCVKFLIRLWVPNFGSVVDLSTKFGAHPDTVEKIITECAKAQHIKFAGFSFHVGSQCLNPANFTKAFDIALKAVANAKKLGFETEYFDIGGGNPVDYTLEISYAEEISQTLSQLLLKVPTHIKIIAEPGRNIVATAATVVTQIIGKTVKRGKTWYYVDESIYSTFSGKIYDFTEYKFFPLHKSAVPGAEVVIAGNTCDGYDIISRETLLPHDLEEGDFLYIPNVGAYTIASASFFNGFEPANVIIFDEKT